MMHDISVESWRMCGAWEKEHEGGRTACAKAQRPNKLGLFQDPKEEACSCSRLRGGLGALSSEIFPASGGTLDFVRYQRRAATLSGVCGFVINLFCSEMTVDLHAL